VFQRLLPLTPGGQLVGLIRLVGERAHGAVCHDHDARECCEADESPRKGGEIVIEVCQTRTWLRRTRALVFTSIESIIRARF
jgi:hypothetical protein